MNEWGWGGVILDGQSGVLILGEGGKINHQCFKYIYTICICITGTRISSQFTFIVDDIYIFYMYIYTGYLWEKKDNCISQFEFMYIYRVSQKKWE